MKITLGSFALFVAAFGACTTFGSSPQGEQPDGGAVTEAGTDALVLPSDGGDETSGPLACVHLPRGVAKPCTSCVVDQVHAIVPGDATVGPFVFGVAVDATHVYWIEQSGDRAYDGVGTTSIVKRKSLSSGSTEESLVTTGIVFNRLALTSQHVWLGSGDPGFVTRFDKSCAGSACTLVPLGVLETASRMVPFKDGLAVATGGPIRTYNAQGSPSFVNVELGTRGLAWLGESRLAYVVERSTTGPSDIKFIGGGDPLPLLPLHPSPANSAFEPRGASHVAASCDGNLWAVQRFRKERRGGEDFVFAVVRAGASMSPVGTPIESALFMASDATHAYIGQPNGKGLVRANPDGTTNPVVPQVSAWSLSVTDDYVYFDDHGTLGSPSSKGIFRMKKSD